MRNKIVAAFAALLLVFATRSGAAQGGTIGGGGGGAACCSAATITPADSIRFTGTTSVIRGGAGNMTIQAGTGNSRTMTLQSTTSAGTAKNTLVLGADSSATFLGKIAITARGSTMGIHETAGNSRIYFASGGDTVVTTVAGSAKIRANSGSVDILDNVRISNFGSAAAPDFAIQANFSGTQSGVYRPHADTLGLSSAGVAFAKGVSDTLIVWSKAKAPSLTAASGTPNTVCMDATSKELLENAATSCVVSSARYKQDIAPLSDSVAARIVATLRPSSFLYRNGGRTAIGLIAEQVNAIDNRLVSYDAQGRPNSVNYEQVTVALLSVVQQQQRDIDALYKIILALGGAATAAGAAATRRRRATSPPTR